MIFITRTQFCYHWNVLSAFCNEVITAASYKVPVGKYVKNTDQILRKLSVMHDGMF